MELEAVKKEVGLAVMKASWGSGNIWPLVGKFLMTLTRIRDLSVEETSEDGELLFIESDSENQSEDNIKPRQTDASSAGMGKGLF